MVMYTSTLDYYDPKTEAHVTHPNAEMIYSGRGCFGPSYHEVYRLRDGSYLSGVRFHDGGALTDVRCSATKPGVLPAHGLLH
jgi:hypothetical protein